MSRHPQHDPVAEGLRRRLDHVTAAARGLLGPGEHGPAGDPLDDVEHLLAAIEARLDAADAGAGWRQARAAHAEQLERLAARFTARSDALRAVDDALGRLREITAPGAILRRAPAELSASSQLPRVVLSLIRDGLIVPEAVFVAGDPDAAGALLEHLATNPPRLEHPLLEADLLRRRRATIVTDVQMHPRTHGATAQVMGWHSYVAAPLVVRRAVVGALHADTGSGGRALDVLDGDVVWAFARGLADLYETTSLRRSLRSQRTEMRRFVDWLDASSSELADAPVGLVRERPAPPDPPGGLEVAAVGSTVDDRVVFENLLTRRELDVLRLLARGETNATIAAELVISEATVKFHVVNLLRKLRVSNRAEAVGRYHRLVRVRSREEPRSPGAPS